jgi:hypothetical protein
MLTPHSLKTSARLRFKSAVEPKKHNRVKDASIVSTSPQTVLNGWVTWKRQDKTEQDRIIRTNLSSLSSQELGILFNLLPHSIVLRAHDGPASHGRSRHAWPSPHGRNEQLEEGENDSLFDRGEDVGCTSVCMFRGPTHVLLRPQPTP